jgi:hypothetical protein
VLKRGPGDCFEKRQNGARRKQVDIVFHYPPELTQLLINTIPFALPGKTRCVDIF